MPLQSGSIVLHCPVKMREMSSRAGLIYVWQIFFRKIKTPYFPCRLERRGRKAESDTVSLSGVTGERRADEETRLGVSSHPQRRGHPLVHSQSTTAEEARANGSKCVSSPLHTYMLLCPDSARASPSVPPRSSSSPSPSLGLPTALSGGETTDAGVTGAVEGVRGSDEAGRWGQRPREENLDQKKTNEVRACRVSTIHSSCCVHNHFSLFPRTQFGSRSLNLMLAIVTATSTYVSGRSSMMKGETS